MVTYGHVKWELISKLLIGTFSWHPLITGTLKLDSISFLFKCENSFSPKMEIYTYDEVGNGRSLPVFEAVSAWAWLALGVSNSELALPSLSLPSRPKMPPHCL